MYQDFKELLSAFNAHKVKYLIIGGYAVGFHAEPRATKDLDILIGNNPENAKAVYAALKSFGAPLRGVKPADLIEKDSFFRIGKPPVMIDILSAASGIDFNAAWSSKTSMIIGPRIKAWVVSCADLIDSKIAAGRPQDLADVAALHSATAVTKPAKKKKRLKK